MVLGLWLLFLGSSFKAQGTCYTAPGSWFKARGSWLWPVVISWEWWPTHVTGLDMANKTARSVPGEGVAVVVGDVLVVVCFWRAGCC